MDFHNVVLFQDIHQISCLQSDRWHKSVATDTALECERHRSLCEWLQLQDLLSDGEGRVRLVGIILSYIVLLKTLFPLRLGATLFLTPRMKSFLGGLGLTEQG